MWALLLILGFALIYYPWMERFLVSPGSLRAHWTEALYFSGFAASTPPEGPTSASALASGALEQYLIAADRRFVRGPTADPVDGGLERRYRRLLEYLAYDPDEVAQA